jgi:hypothetical protein
MSVFPVQPGNVDHSSDSATRYIPAIFSTMLIDRFYPQTVWSEISK